jgi:hypothetical protein
MKSPVRKVPKQAALNMVARAIARTRLEQVTRDAKVAIWGFDDGADAKKQVLTIGHTLGMTLAAIGYDKKENDPEYALAIGCINEAMQVCCNSGPDFKWKKEWTLVLDDGLDAILLVTPKLTPHAINHGVKTMSI